MRELIKPLRPATQLPGRHPSRTSGAEGNVTAVAWARARDGTAWQLVLSFTDRDGRRHEVLVKRCEITRGDLLFELLDDHGCPIPTNHCERAALRRSIVAANPEKRVLITEKGKLVPQANSDPAAVQTAVAKIIERLPKLAKQALDISKSRHRVDSKVAASASVLHIADTTGERLLAVRPAALQKMIGSAASEKAVTAVLEQRGLLVPGGNGRRTRELRLPGGKVRRSYYCLRLSVKPPTKPEKGSTRTE